MNPFGNSAPPASGNPTPIHSDTLAVRALEKAVATLEVHREVMKAASDRVSASTDDMVVRVARLETKVDALPNKIWIGTAIAAAVTFLTGVIGIVAVVAKVYGGH